MTNKMTTEQELRYSARIYRKTIKPLEDALISAIRCGYPEEHIHMLEHMIEVAKAVAEFETANLPIVPRKAGRPRKDEPTVKDKCREIFYGFTPRFVPSKTRKKDGLDAKGRAIPQEGLVFNFNK